MKRTTRSKTTRPDRSNVAATQPIRPTPANSQKRTTSTVSAGVHHPDTQIAKVSATGGSGSVGVQVATEPDRGLAVSSAANQIQVQVDPGTNPAVASDSVAVTRSYKPGLVDRWLIGPFIFLCAVVVYALVAVRGNVDRLWDILSRIV